MKSISNKAGYSFWLGKTKQNKQTKKNNYQKSVKQVVKLGASMKSND